MHCRFRKWEHAPQGEGGGNMPRRVREGEICFGGLVGSGWVSNKCLFG